MLKNSFLTLVLGATLLSPSLGFAQDQPAGFLSVTTFTVAPGMTAQFETVARQINEAYKQTGAEPQANNLFVSAFGGHGRTYRFVTLFNEFNEMDNWRQIPDVLAEAYGQEKAASILMSGDASFSAVESSISFTQVDASSVSGDAPSEFPALATVIRTEVDFAKIDDYNVFLRKLKEAEEAAGVSWTRRRTIRGQFNVFTAVRQHDTLGNNPPLAYSLLREHLGPVEANLLIERQDDAVLHRDIEILRHRPDLSR